MNSLLASVLAAVRPGADPHSLEEGIMPDAEVSTIEPPPLGASTGVSSMTLPNTPAGGALAGAELAAAISTATSGGHESGFKAATERLGAIMSADGIKGDGKRMAAALDLSQQSPEMSAEAVAAFVVANVSASTADAGTPGKDASDYEQKRLSAAALAQPGATSTAPKATIDRNAIFASRRAAAKGV